MDKSFLDRFLRITPLMCAFLVIGVHCYTVPAEYAKSPTGLVESAFSHGICTAAVPIFMLISGYLFYRNAESIKDVLDKQKKRVVSYLMPFLVWSLLYYILYIVLSKIGLSSVQVDLSLTGIIRGVVFYEYVFPLWFLFQLLVYTLLAPVIFCLLKSNKAAIVVLLAFAVLGIFDLSLRMGVGIEDGRTIFSTNFFAYFLAGAIASRNKEKLLKAEEKALKMNTLLCVVLALIFGATEGIIYNLDIAFNKRILVPLVVLFTLISLDKLSVWIENKRFDPSVFPTMAIYAAHPIIVILLNSTIARLPLPDLIQYIILYLGTVVISCAVSFVIKNIKPLRFVLCGNR